MARTLFFRMVLRKFSEITNNKPILSQYNIFYNYEYFFFQSMFWYLFNHRKRSQSNEEQCSLCCFSPCFLVLLCTHYGTLLCFSTYSCKLKEIGVLRHTFPDCYFLWLWFNNYYFSDIFFKTFAKLMKVLLFQGIISVAQTMIKLSNNDALTIVRSFSVKTGVSYLWLNFKNQLCL